MPIPTTGAVSLLDVQTEFGGAAPISINEYYNAATGVPTSGVISMSQFRGTSAVPIYAFTPTNTYTVSGTAVAGGGMPDDYNPATHGNVIWPAGKGEGGAGWVGSTFTATTAVTYFQFVSDNTCAAYLGSNTGTVLVCSSSNWREWGTGSVATIPGRTYTVSLYVTDAGGGYGTAGRVYASDGTTLALTTTSWVSA